MSRADHHEAEGRVVELEDVSMQAALRDMTESELKALVVDIAHSNDWRVFSLPMIKNMRPVKDAVGYPDLTLARNGRVLFLELKVEDGVLGPEQMQWMRELGPYMFVVRPSNVDDVRFLLT